MATIEAMVAHMTDKQNTRELLELAAKAKGGLVFIEDMGWIEEFQDGQRGNWWNPLEDDGDCARMEGANHISITWDYPNRCVKVRAKRWMDLFEHSEPYGDNWQAARRLASTTLMAKIGRKM